ncbi:hypothetical protein Q671_07110 [Halomonas sp. PBN3]|nr:hypothetical protein Q671_07110 [Halomonas sp. PBN3]
MLGLQTQVMVSLGDMMRRMFAQDHGGAAALTVMDLDTRG